MKNFNIITLARSSVRLIRSGMRNTLDFAQVLMSIAPTTEVMIQLILVNRRVIRGEMGRELMMKRNIQMIPDKTRLGYKPNTSLKMAKK